MMRIRRPSQERGDVFRSLAGSARRAIIILDDLIVKGLRHANGSAAEVWVVVLIVIYRST